MNTTEYISSGILELYAAGALSESERAEVEALAHQYPEIQAELKTVIATLDQYAAIHAVTPPDHLKSKVLQAVFNQNTNQRTDNQEFVQPESAKIIKMLPDNAAASYAFKWLVAASVVLLVISNVLSFYFYNNWKQSEQRLQYAMVEQQQYAQNLRQVQNRIAQNEKTIALLSDAGTKRVLLKGVPEKSPESEVTVYWHNITKNVYVEVNNLPEAPEGYQYQLWALADGKPIDAGLLTDLENIADFQQMKEVQKAQAFAITLEPQGGSINPTPDQMYVIGNI